MSQGQLEQIKEFDKDLNVVQQLKADLDNYNLQLNGLVAELSSKTEECQKLKQFNIELGLKTEQFKMKAKEFEEQLLTELDYKKMYDELKYKVDEYTFSTKKKSHSDSPLRTIDQQSDNIRLREQNLNIHSELNDMKEQNFEFAKLMKKKDSQIQELKYLIEDGDNLRQNLDKFLKDKK